MSPQLASGEEDPFENPNLKYWSRILTAMGNEHRVQILDLLAFGQKTLSEIMEKTGLDRDRAEAHLAILVFTSLVLKWTDDEGDGEKIYALDPRNYDFARGVDSFDFGSIKVEFRLGRSRPGKRALIPKKGDFHRAVVELGLPWRKFTPFEVERILDRVEEFMHALGFDYTVQGNAIRAAFLQRLHFETVHPRTRIAISEAFAQGRQALWLNYLRIPTHELPEKIADAAWKIEQIVDAGGSVAMRFGRILLAKIEKEGDARFLVKVVDNVALRQIESIPGFMNDPKLVYDFLDAKGGGEETACTL